MNAILTVSFEIFHLADLANLKNLISKLDTDDGHVRLNLELDFGRPSLMFSRYYLLNRLFESLEYINSSIHSVVLKNCNDEFQLDLNKYLNISNLWLENYNNTQIPNMDILKLNLLVVIPVKEYQHVSVDMLKLPNTIKVLQIDGKQSSFIYRIENHWWYSPLPHIITMNDVRDSLPKDELNKQQPIGAKLQCTGSHDKKEARKIVLLLKEFIDGHQSQLASLSVDSEIAEVIAEAGIKPEFELICLNIKDTSVQSRLLSLNSQLVKLVLENVPDPKN